MVKPVVERLAGDRNAELAHVGEVLLAEDHISTGTVECPPFGDATFQCPAHSRDDLGMPPTHLLEDRHRTNAGRGLQHRHDVVLPHPGKRVGSARQALILFVSKESDAAPNHSDRQTTFAPLGESAAGDSLTSGNGCPPLD